MIDARCNFKNKNKSKNVCRLKCGQMETQEHIFCCPFLGKNIKSEFLGKMNSKNLNDNKNAACELKRLLLMRKNIYRKLTFKENNLKKKKERT